MEDQQASTPVLPTPQPPVPDPGLSARPPVFRNLRILPHPMPIEYSVLIMDLGSDRLYQRQPSFYIVIDCTTTAVNHESILGEHPDICQTLKDSERAFQF